MSLKKLLTLLLCGALFVAGLSFTACDENSEKPNGGGNQGQGNPDLDEGWTDIY